MTPQGSTIIDTAYFTALTASISAANSCSELQVLVSEVSASLAAVESGINAELAAIAPILALLTVPDASLSAIIGWLTSYISNVLTPLVKPNITYAAQLAATAVQITELTAAIAAAASRFPSCSVSL